MSGSLHIIATPIGNLGDLTPRIKASLSEVDLILAEDTRVTIKILNHLGIKKRMISCHDFNEKSRLKIITEASLLNQKVALVSDAGTPLISDPGNEIVRQAIACGMKVIPIPGPSAFLLALVASGLPCDRFVFEGFLPAKPGLLKQRLEDLQDEKRTIVIYESPHRLLKTLSAIKEIFGDREICLARELTKLHEEIIRASLSQVLSKLSNSPNTRNESKAKILGEYVLVIAGNEKTASTDKANNELHGTIEQMLDSGMSVKTVAQQMAKAHRLRRSDIYQLCLQIQAKHNVDK